MSIDWSDVIEEAELLKENSVEAAAVLKEAAEISGPVVYCYDPYDHAVFIEKEAGTSAAVAAALTETLDPHRVYTGLSCRERPDNMWVKVAYSPMLRRLGETLQFFPSKEPEWWSHPSPYAALLASALLGAGAGYAGGALVDKVIGRKTRLGRVLGSTAGGVAASMPAATWIAMNAADGRPLNDPSLLDSQPPEQGESVFKQADAEYFPQGTPMMQARPPGPYDVDFDALGRSAWFLQSQPGTQAGIMGAAGVAATQAGGLYGYEGVVTPLQFGRLAVQTGGNALVGALAGALLGKMTNTPELKMAGALAGAAATLVPRLFGH